MIDLDDTLDNADWLKRAWDLPPYGSKEFFNVVPIADLPAFRQLPVYRNAVARGLIHDDEWVGDWTVDPHEKFADLLLDLALHGPPADVAKAYSPETRPADGY